MDTAPLLAATLPTVPTLVPLRGGLLTTRTLLLAAVSQSMAVRDVYKRQHDVLSIVHGRTLRERTRKNASQNWIQNTRIARHVLFPHDPRRVQSQGVDLVIVLNVGLDIVEV